MMALFSGLISTDGSVEREVVTVDPGIERWIPAYFQADDQPRPEEVTAPGLPAEQLPGMDLASLPSPPSSIEKTAISTIQQVDSTDNLSLEKMEIQETPRTHSVIDPTGGGNAFLGGLSVGLARQKTILEATSWGSIAASFAIEQVGVPTLGVDGEGKETWNGVRVEERLEEFCRRVGL